MKTFKILITGLSIIFFQHSLFGQQGAWKFNAGYSVAFPTGNLKNLVDETSLRGWSAAVLYGVTEKASVGIASGFQDFYQKYPREVLHGEGSDVSAVVSNSIQVIPIMLKGKYNFLQDGRVQLFAAMAAGGNFIQYNKYYGQFVDSRSKFGFAAQPEIGMYIPISKMRRIGLDFSAAYSIMPFKYNDADGLGHIALRAGINIPLQR